VNNEKSFLQRLYEALEAEDLDPKNNPGPTTDPSGGVGDLFLAPSNPPPGGGGENRVQKGLTYYQEDTLKLHLPGKDPKASFLVGAPLLPPAKPPVASVCKADGNGPQKLLELLQEIGRSLLPYGNRALWRKVGTVVFLLPLEMAALNLGVSRQTVYSWRKKLEEKGLVATDTLHQKLPNGEYRAIGTLWAVRLRPGKARLTLDDYIYPWRNLAVDMANGILSYNWVKAYEEKGIRPTLDVLIFWAQGRRVLPLTKTVAVDLGLILVLPEVERSKLPALITLIATYLANVLDDHRSRRFYAGLLWAVVRGEIPAQYLFSLLVRVIRDYTEGFLTKPGAYLVKTLKTLEKEAS
jgi:transposase-like protein